MTLALIHSSVLLTFGHVAYVRHLIHNLPILREVAKREVKWQRRLFRPGLLTRVEVILSDRNPPLVVSTQHNRVSGLLNTREQTYACS